MNALVQENNALLTRIQHRARQNHLLLRQSLDLMQRFLTTLFPSHEPRVYNGGGQMPSASRFMTNSCCSSRRASISPYS